MRPRAIVWAALLAVVVPMVVRDGGGGGSVGLGVVKAQAPGGRLRMVCVQRWSRPGDAGVACQAGELLTGGGCTCPGGTLRSTYASGSDGTPGTAWQCDGQCPSGLKAVAMCCSVPSQ